MQKSSSTHAGDALIELAEEATEMFGDELEVLRRIVQSMALKLNAEQINDFVIDFRIEHEMEFPNEFHFVVEEDLSDGLEEEDS